MKQLNKTLELYLIKKAPALPKNVKEILVKFAPWGSIILVVLGLPAVFALLGLGAIISSPPYGGYSMMRTGGGLSLSWLLLLATIVLEALAIPGLFKKKLAGWNFLYWGVWVNAVYQLLSFQIIGLIVSTLISLYVLFQVKSYYK